MLPRGKGRPLGSPNRAAKFRNYTPRRWHPEFDLIVIESISGKSNEEIGRQFGYTKEHISNILSTEEATKVRERVRETINKEFDGKLKDRLANIGTKCVEKIETFVMDERGLEEKSPFMFIDRVVAIAKSTSTLVDNTSKSVGNTTIVNGNALVINNDQADGLKDALMKSMSLDSISTGDKTEDRNIEQKPFLKLSSG